MVQIQILGNRLNTNHGYDYLDLSLKQ